MLRNVGVGIGRGGRELDCDRLSSVAPPLRPEPVADTELTECSESALGVASE